MEIELVKDYIASFQKRELPEIVKRELQVKTLKGKCTIIFGPRRSGKTFYFFEKILEIERRNTAYFDFEEPFLTNLKATDVLKIILEIFPEVTGNLPEYIFLDEVQNIAGWENLVRSLLNRDFQVLVTGSSSKLMSKEIATALRGRSLSYLLLPFSFREYLNAKKLRYNLNILADVGKVKKELKSFLEFGGFPEVVLKEEKERILKEYLELALFKDFIERHKIKSITLGRIIFNYLLQNFSSEFSVRALERKLRGERIGFNIMTLYRYVEALEDTLFVFFLRKFSKKVHEREGWPRKAYLCDQGLTKVIKFSPDYGKLMENCVFLELKRKTIENHLIESYYWKDYQQNEVDFVIKSGLDIKQLIQVTYASSKDEIEKREIKALIKASDLLNCDNLLIITWDYEEEIKAENKTIKCLPLWKWLLNL